MPEEQARIQAEAMRGQSEASAFALRSALKDYDDDRKKDIASKEDVIQVQAALRETELRLQKEMQGIKYSLLKWQIGGWVALAAIMAKGFGRIGF